MADPRMRRLAPVLLYRTLGPTLPDGAAAAAVLWAAAHQLAASNPAGVTQAGYGEGLAAGERLFEAILSGSHGVVITDDELRRVVAAAAAPSGSSCTSRSCSTPSPPCPTGRSRPTIRTTPTCCPPGRRRAFTANTIIRDPDVAPA